MLDLEHIKRCAAEVGFDLCGVAKCHPMPSDGAFLQRWLEEGNGSTLAYLERNAEKRADTTLLVEGAKSVIVCAIAYKNPISEGYAPNCRTKIASYACAEDYHTTIRRMLQQLCERLRSEHPTLRGRVFTDSAPIFEKRYAVEAGLGWIGRQSLLVTPQFGTFVLLGEAVVCFALGLPLLAALEKRGFRVLRCADRLLEESSPGTTWFVIAQSKRI